MNLWEVSDSDHSFRWHLLGFSNKYNWDQRGFEHSWKQNKRRAEDQALVSLFNMEQLASAGVFQWRQRRRWWRKLKGIITGVAKSFFFFFFCIGKLCGHPSSIEKWSPQQPSLFLKWNSPQSLHLTMVHAGVMCQTRDPENAAIREVSGIQVICEPQQENSLGMKFVALIIMPCAHASALNILNCLFHSVSANKMSPESRQKIHGVAVPQYPEWQRRNLPVIKFVVDTQLKTSCGYYRDTTISSSPAGPDGRTCDIIYG